MELVTQNGTVQAHGKTWPLYENEAYSTEILGTVPPESVEAYKAELLSLCTRYGVVPKVRKVTVLSMTPEDQAEKNALDEKAIAA